MKKKISDKSKVKFHYKVTDQNNNIRDNTYRNLQPIEFKMGEGVMLPSFEKNILGLTEGSLYKFNLPKEECYGNYNEELVIELKKDKIDLDEGIQIGSQIKGETPEGKKFNCTLKEIKKETVVLDFNHPLAGNSLTFDLEIINVKE